LKKLFKTIELGKSCPEIKYYEPMKLIVD
jgi:hypothetical protein